MENDHDYDNSSGIDTNSSSPDDGFFNSNKTLWRPSMNRPPFFIEFLGKVYQSSLVGDGRPPMKRFRRWTFTSSVLQRQNQGKEIQSPYQEWKKKNLGGLDFSWNERNRKGSHEDIDPMENTNKKEIVSTKRATTKPARSQQTTKQAMGPYIWRIRATTEVWVRTNKASSYSPILDNVRHAFQHLNRRPTWRNRPNTRTPSNQATTPNKFWSKGANGS